MKKVKEGKVEVSFFFIFIVYFYFYYKKNWINVVDVIVMECEWVIMVLSMFEVVEMQVVDLCENGLYFSLGVNILLDMYIGKISMVEGDKILNQLVFYGY